MCAVGLLLCSMEERRWPGEGKRRGDDGVVRELWQLQSGGQFGWPTTNGPA